MSETNIEIVISYDEAVHCLSALRQQLMFNRRIIGTSTAEHAGYVERENDIIFPLVERLNGIITEYVKNELDRTDVTRNR